MDTSTFGLIARMCLQGLRLTLGIAVAGILIGTVIGSLAGYALQAENKIAKAISNAYIWVIRATPLVVQALYGYYVIPKLTNTNPGSTFVGVCVIALNSGAFISEIVRGALQGIDDGQREAGMSLGMTYTQTLIHVIIPPAFKAALPPLFNQFIISVKDTALLSIIAVDEMTHMAQNYMAMSFKYVEGYTILALFYLGIISVLILIQRQIERSMR